MDALGTRLLEAIPGRLDASRRDQSRPWVSPAPTRLPGRPTSRIGLRNVHQGQIRWNPRPLITRRPVPRPRRNGCNRTRNSGNADRRRPHGRTPSVHRSHRTLRLNRPVSSVEGDRCSPSPSCHRGFDIGSSATRKNRGHVHALNRHGPVSAWMNSEWRHPEQWVARHAPRSIQ